MWWLLANDPGFWDKARHAIAYWLGLTSPDQPPYLFWSGFGGSIRDILVIVLIIRYFRSQEGSWWDRHQPPPSL